MKKSQASINLILITSLFLVGILVFANYKQSRDPASQKDVSQLKIPVYEFDTTKINASENSFKFYRAFVDFYYLTLKSNEDFLTEIASMNEFSAWCAGDAHAENFGFLIQSNNNSIFTLNDWDDSTNCPAFLDITRLLVGNQLFDKDISSADLLDKYIEGLELREYPFPAVMLKELEKSKSRSTSIASKKLEGPNRLLKSSDSEELSVNEKKLIQSILTTKINRNLVVLDSLKFKKVGGGSGGLRRYNMLVQIGTAHFLLELKQIQDSSAKVYEKVAMPPTERLLKSFDNFMMSDIHPFYQAVILESTPYLIRPLFDGNIGINLTKYKNKEIVDVLKYEAYMLGYLHSYSLVNKEQYISAVKAISRQKYLSEIKELKVLFQYLYKELK